MHGLIKGSGFKTSNSPHLPLYSPLIKYPLFKTIRSLVVLGGVLQGLGLFLGGGGGLAWTPTVSRIITFHRCWASDFELLSVV